MDTTYTGLKQKGWRLAFNKNREGWSVSTLLYE